MKINELIGRNGIGMRIAGLALAGEAFLFTGGAFAGTSEEGPAKKEESARRGGDERKREAPAKRVRHLAAPSPLDPDIAVLEFAAPKPKGVVTSSGRVRAVDVLEEKGGAPEIVAIEAMIPYEPDPAPPQIYFTHTLLKLYLFWLGVDIDTALQLGFLEDQRLIQMFLAELKNVLLRMRPQSPGGVDADIDPALSQDADPGTGVGGDDTDFGAGDEDTDAATPVKPGKPGPELAFKEDK